MLYKKVMTRVQSCWGRYLMKSASCLLFEKRSNPREKLMERINGAFFNLPKAEARRIKTKFGEINSVSQRHFAKWRHKSFQ